MQGFLMRQNAFQQRAKSGTCAGFYRIAGRSGIRNLREGLVLLFIRSCLRFDPVLGKLGGNPLKGKTIHLFVLNFGGSQIPNYGLY